MLEIGGSSLLGLATIREFEEFDRCTYTIVDHAPPASREKLSSLQGRYLQKSCADVVASDLEDPISCVIAVRALEYDPNYGRTLATLQSLAGDTCYGWLVHNASESSALQQVNRHQRRLAARIISLDFLISCCDHGFVPEDFSACASSLRALLDKNKESQEFRFIQNEYNKLTVLTDARQRQRLKEEQQELRTQFQVQLEKLMANYQDRIASRRFWCAPDSQQVKGLYTPHGINPLSRGSFVLGDQSDLLTGYVDTVDIANNWRKLGRDWHFDPRIPNPSVFRFDPDKRDESLQEELLRRINELFGWSSFSEQT
jgi:hypothetical protein